MSEEYDNTTELLEAERLAHVRELVAVFQAAYAAKMKETLAVAAERDALRALLVMIRNSDEWTLLKMRTRNDIDTALAGEKL